MGSDKRQGAFQYLLEQAERQGYVIFDDIMDCADNFSLSIQDFDWLSSSITTRGIIVYDEKPVSRVTSEQEDYDDYAQSDYDEIYCRIIELDKELEPFILTVKNIKPPQWKEFTQLKYQVQEGNHHARERMIEMHLRIALKIALNRSEIYDMDIQDAVGEACIGLVTAVDKYNPDINGAFSSYASMWILQNLSRNQSTRRPLMYYPVHRKDAYFSVYPMLKDNDLIGKRGITDIKKAEKLLRDKNSFTDREIEDIFIAVMPFESFEEKYSTFFENTDFSKECDEEERQEYPPELIADINIEQQITDTMLQEQISEVLGTLKEREQKVIELRYGLNGEKEKTLEEVGDIFNLTRERVRQIEKKALRNLRHPSRSRKLQDYIDFVPEDKEEKDDSETQEV